MLCAAVLLLAQSCSEQETRSRAGAGADSAAATQSQRAARAIDGANGFESHEVFPTSTQAGYDAYAAWDATHLYFGYTGQNVGAAACTPGRGDAEGCPPHAQGESSWTYVTYYIDADPQGPAGTRTPRADGGRAARLPFRADYLVRIRTDYDSSRVAGLFAWTGRTWSDQGRAALEVADNDDLKFLELGLDRRALGEPATIRVVSWFVDEERGARYAFWPHDANTSEADTTEALAHSYGFVLRPGQTPNASGGQANKDRPFFAGYDGGTVNGNAPEGPSPGQSFPFHSLGLTTANDFSAQENFATSTQAATGYDAYASWDAETLYFGYTGSDLGPGDCTDGERNGGCPHHETGQSATKWLVYYLDTDPQAGERGTSTARAGAQAWTLPFRADYRVLVRTDGVTNDRGYTGVADVQAWNGGGWASRGPEALEVFINSTSGFAKFAVSRDSLGQPRFLQVASWIYDTARDTSYAFWPARAVAPEASAQEAATEDTTHWHLRHAYGFVLTGGQRPNTSGGQANLDRTFFAGLAPKPVNGDAPPGQGASAPQPFHTVGFTTSNDFTGSETFRTSTQAATGYDAYASWDAETLYFGATGSDVGPGDCAGDDCPVYQTGQSPNKWVFYYLDTDPFAEGGTRHAQALGTQSWTLPFRADYAVRLRTDGETVEGQYTGVATLLRWDGKDWKSLGPHALDVFDNSTSGFLKVAVSRQALGSPEAISVAGWFADAKAGRSYAYWPRSAPRDPSSEGITHGAAVLDDAYGFHLRDGQMPAASGGSANLNRPFFDAATCPARAFDATGSDAGGASRPFHTLTVNGSNGFTKQEIFATSTPGADTGYDAYATWDRRTLYLGYTGSNVGGGDCPAAAASENCTPAETGQGAKRWLAYYLDTDPGADGGTHRAYAAPDTLGTRQQWRLPFAADYAFLLRTDGATGKSGHTGVVEVKKWNGTRWVSRGPCALDVWDDNDSGFLELAVDLADLGFPAQVKIAGWMFGEDESYAYWPADAASDGPARGTRLASWWGFPLHRAGVRPNAKRHKNRRFEQALGDQVTPGAYTVDGQHGPGERLPAESLGRENEGSAPSPDNPELFLTWDDAHLSLALEGGALRDETALYVAFDTSRSQPGDPRAGPGRTSLPSPSGSLQAPFAADVVYRFGPTATGAAADTAAGRRFTVADGGWAGEPLPEGTSVARGDSLAEIALPWDAFGDDFAATDRRLHVVAYLADRKHGTRAQWPPQNPDGASVAFGAFRSYRLANGVAPGAPGTLSLRVENGTTLSAGRYANLYLTPPSAQTVTLGAHTTVAGDLFVGPRATLDVGASDRAARGAHRLRVGRRLQVAGTLEPRQGMVSTYRAPGAEAPTALLCDASFHALTLRDETALRPCSGGQTRLHVRDTLRLAARGALNANGHAVQTRRADASSHGAAPADSSDAPPQADAPAQQESGTSLHGRFEAFLRRQKEQ